MQGIYQIRCLPENRVYVGSSVNIKRRWRSHRHDLRWQKHHCPELQEAWIKYEEQDFVWEILEVVSKKESLPERELAQILAADRPYNQTEETSNPMRNPETVKKNIQARGDKLSGYKGPGAKFRKEQYLEIFGDLKGPMDTASIAKKWNVSNSTVQAIAEGESHLWLASEEGYQDMLKHRAKIKKLGRLYKYETTEGRPPIKPKADQIKETNKLINVKRSNVVAPEQMPKDRPEPPDKNPEKATRKHTDEALSKMQKKYATFTEYELKHKDGSVASMTWEEWEQLGFKEKFWDQLLRGKILSYKGYKFIKKHKVKREIIVDE